MVNPIHEGAVRLYGGNRGYSLCSDASGFYLCYNDFVVREYAVDAGYQANRDYSVMSGYMGEYVSF